MRKLTIEQAVNDSYTFTELEDLELVKAKETVLAKLTLIEKRALGLV